MWLTKENLVINYIDAILLHAIHSSQSTTPIKSENKSLPHFNRFLRKTWNLGLDPDEKKEEDDEGSDELSSVTVALQGKVVVLQETSKP